MSKKIISITTFIIIIIVINIDLHKSGTMICTYNSTTDVYSISTKYTITYKNRVVTNLSTKEIINSSDEKMLNEYRITLDSMYDKYKNLKYYDNSVILNKNKLTSITKINYEKLNKSEFIKIDSNNKNIYQGNNVKLNKLKRFYKENDIKCSYK